MASDENSLQALEGLMNEFFAGQTTNERKREIETILNSFCQTRDAWRHSLYFLANTRNEYVMMFCMTAMENMINRQWIGLSAEDKLVIRSTLNQFLLEHHTKVPNYIRNKLVKVIVDIGRIDWPHFYPDFLSNILQLTSQTDTVLLGVIILQTVSEELATPREDLSMARKEELQRLLIIQVPNILSLLNNILESVLEKHRHLVAATPPPSPTSGERNNHRGLESSMLLISSSPSDSILSNMFKSPGRHVQIEALPPLDDQSKLLCTHALTTLSQYFSWIPLSSTITPQLLSTIFHFAGFGCETKSSSSSSNFNTNTQSLGILAMNCINELLSKNCVPVEFEDFLLQMFQQTFYLLQKLTKDSSTNSTGNRLSEIDEGYLEKFTDFLKLFVSIHLRRFESNPKFSVMEFLALFLKYTFRQPTFDGYYNCLDTWNTFLDFIHTKERTAEWKSIITRYQEALLTLVSHILNKLQFKYNQSQLEELDDDILDDDSETEWQQFIRQSLEVVAKVAEMLTAETFQLLYQPFSENLHVYHSLEQYIAASGNKRHLIISAENECRRLHCALKDLSSLLQALGRMAEHFIGENFPQRLSDGTMLLEKLVSCVEYGTKTKLYEVRSTVQNVLDADFQSVQAQAIASVKAFCHWLSQYYNEVNKEPQMKQKFISMMTTLLEAVTPLFSSQVPERIVHSAAHVVLSITTTVKPAFLLQLPCIQNLLSSVTQGALDSLTTEVQLLVYRSMSNALILPWPNESDAGQNWTERASHHQIYVQQIARNVLLLKSELGNHKHLREDSTSKQVIRKALSIFQDWIEAVSGEVVKSKQICYQSLQEVIQVSIALFPIYLHPPEVEVIEAMMSFFLSLFQGLRVQMGVAFTQQTITTFMSLFTQQQLAETIFQESSAAHRVVEKFLKILELVVQEPGSAFKSFIPSVISICIDQIYPIIAQRPSPDMKLVLYNLLHELLVHNWRYFFKSNVLMKMNNEPEQVENVQQFTSVLQSYGQSFLQPDIDVFRQNLESLENLNFKWKLYSKTIFAQGMLTQFLNVLLQVLVHRSHDLLQEEITVTIHNMACVDFERFYNDFLHQFLSDCEGLSPDQKSVLQQNFKTEKDLPSFSQSIQRLVNDLRYYRQVNSSLPEGSVKF
ncbi:exportin-6-like [Mytilus edulis]|uniref:exportin-6-like n=1 Tax=Mytilus edulis TaxID=6550 RepID=UPI0039EE9047